MPRAVLVVPTRSPLQRLVWKSDTRSIPGDYYAYAGEHAERIARSALLTGEAICATAAEFESAGCDELLFFPDCRIQARWTCLRRRCSTRTFLKPACSLRGVLLMARYMFEFTYTTDAWAALVREPADRSAGVDKLCRACGGRLVEASTHSATLTGWC
jgi:hypothetical protein